MFGAFRWCVQVSRSWTAPESKLQNPDSKCLFTVYIYLFCKYLFTEQSRRGDLLGERVVLSQRDSIFKGLRREKTWQITGTLTVMAPWWPSGKDFACQCRQRKRCGFDPWIGKIPWRRAWQSTPVFSPGESHGQKSLVGHSSWGRNESDTTETSEATEPACI